MRTPVPELLSLFIRQERGEQTIDPATMREEPTHVSEELARYRLTTELPKNRPQLRVDVEGQTVVDAPDAAIVAAQEKMAGFAVRVVREQVEEGDPLQLRPVVMTTHGAIVRLDIELDRADTIRAVTNDGRWNERPAEDSAEEIGSVLATVEGAAWKVPERGLATGRLVNGDQVRYQGLLQDDSEGTVGSPRDEFHVHDVTDTKSAKDGPDVQRSLCDGESVSCRVPVRSFRYHRGTPSPGSGEWWSVPERHNDSTRVPLVGEWSERVRLAMYVGPRHC